MRVRKHIAGTLNAALIPFGCQVVKLPDPAKSWDNTFLKWIQEAEATGKDPNDIGDCDWSDDPLKEALEKEYWPYIQRNSVVLELGPGTGRVTRHIISRCAEMILVDYSKVVCEWLDKYLKGKGTYRICLIEKPLLSMVSSESVDMVLANGVFEHVDMDDLMCFLEECFRVLKPNGVFSFNFDNMMSEEGLQWFRKWRGEPGSRCLFRFYHPEFVRRMGESIGFKTLQLRTSQSRFASITLQKMSKNSGA